MFSPFQQYIQKAADKYGISKELNAIKICNSFREIVPDLFEKIPQAKDYVTPAHYKNGALTVNVPSPAWAQEVIMRKEKIIDEMNSRAGRKVIRNLYTQLRQY
ncbi:MAG: DUF721 domain-containing protein [Candidatus Gracilibacteria bacterium]|jgi:predicted nucleic acid-binding Zn ribbon protein